MKTKELRQKTDQELVSILREQREKLRRLSFDLAEKKIKNVREVSATKKIIARILTIMGQRATVKK